MKTKITYDEMLRIGACKPSLDWGEQCFPSLKTTWGDLVKALRGGNKLDWILWVSRNPSTPVAVLETLSTDADSDVRYAVSGNPSTLRA